MIRKGCRRKPCIDVVCHEAWSFEDAEVVGGHGDHCNRHLKTRMQLGLMLDYCVENAAVEVVPVDIAEAGELKLKTFVEHEVHEAENSNMDCPHREHKG